VGFQLTETETVTVTVTETEKIRRSQPTESKRNDAIIRTRSSMRREEAGRRCGFVTLNTGQEKEQQQQKEQEKETRVERNDPPCRRSVRYTRKMQRWVIRFF